MQSLINWYPQQGRRGLKCDDEEILIWFVKCPGGVLDTRFPALHEVFWERYGILGTPYSFPHFFINSLKISDFLLEL